MGESRQKIYEFLEQKCFQAGIGAAVNSTTKDGCERVFDGIYCWPETESGQLAVQRCTNSDVISVNKTGLVTKQCTENGTWFVSEETGHHWTNTSNCGMIFYVDWDATKEHNENVRIYDTWFPYMQNSTYLGYGLSIVSIVVALIVLVGLRRLHCERNKLHINLLLSQLLRALMYILKDVLFWNGVALASDISTCVTNGKITLNYTWKCKLFVSVQNYFHLASYFFILMEGLYLHNLIFLNLFSESHGTDVYCFLGWAIPLLFIIPWVALRTLFENNFCWTNRDDQHIILLLELPKAAAVLLNFILFAIIFRVLLVKIHFTSTFVHQTKTKYRQLLKSTLILIPLHGAPYIISIIISWFADQNQMLLLVWIFLDQTFTSFQGFFAALIYCLSNGDVRNEVLRRYSSILHQTEKRFPRSRTISNNTQLSLQNNDDALENLKLFGIVDDSVTKNRVP